MNRHLDDDALRAFLAGAVDEDTAVEMALHLDACPTCTARADGLDPFLARLGDLPDPVVPFDLADAVLARAEIAPQPGVSRLEIAVGASLLTVAAVLAAVFGDPIAAASRIGRFVEALSFVGSKIAVAGPVAVAVLAVATLTLVATSQQSRIQDALLDRRIP